MVSLVQALVIGLVMLAPVQAPADLQVAIGELGSFDFATRTAAAQALRRAPVGAVVPALESAARGHADEYVRFRALVLLSGLDEATTTRVATDLVADRNDRVRTVAYQWFEHHPQGAILPRLIAALSDETSEFTRPALLRALAAGASTPAVRDALRSLVMRGDDLFRGSVIVALGDYRGTFARDELAAVAQLDGPLQDDAVTALGRLGEPSSRSLVAGLQETGPRELQPTVSAALCLLEIDCAARTRFVIETLRFAASSDQQLPLLRGASHAAGVLALAGSGEAFTAMIDAALAARGAAREAVALSLGGVILRQPLLSLEPFEARSPDALAGLYQESFDMLSEDFEEEQFGAAVRREFWAAAAGSARRQAAASVLDALEY